MDEAEMKQDELNLVLHVLSEQSPRGQKFIEAKNELLDDAKKIYMGREKYIEGFKNGILSLNHDNKFEEENRYKEEIKNIRNKNGLIDYKTFMRLIYLKERDISNELVKEHIFVQDLEDLLQKMKKFKNNPEKKEKLG